MNDRLALLSAILAAPADDLPRLVFADWLEENGTTDADVARAEFIRHGCKGKAKSRISPEKRNGWTSTGSDCSGQPWPPGRSPPSGR